MLNKVLKRVETTHFDGDAVTRREVVDEYEGGVTRTVVEASQEEQTEEWRGPSRIQLVLPIGEGAPSAFKELQGLFQGHWDRGTRRDGTQLWGMNHIGLQIMQRTHEAEVTLMPWAREDDLLAASRLIGWARQRGPEVKVTHTEAVPG